MIIIIFLLDDRDCDIPIDPDNQETYIVWGVGGMDETALKHFERSDCKFNLIL